jgi:hypothetical protein
MRKTLRLALLFPLALLGFAAPSAAEPSMVGIWFSAFQPDEPNVMALIEFKPDGTFEEEFRKCENGEVVGAYFESGKWSLMDGVERITVEMINGERSHNEDTYTVEMLTDAERRVRLEPQGFVFASRRVNNFEFPKCATGT